MQTYANFTVGGSLSVNCHGRYVGLGPIILSVKSISVVLADGTLVEASPTCNSEIFYGAIGGYNAIGIIVEAELELTDNVAVERMHEKMPTNQYKYFFIRNIRDNPSAVFHNGDMYPPDFENMRAVTWHETYKMPTVSDRLVPLKQSYPIEQFAMWSVSEMPSGKWAREHIIEPLFYFRKKIHYRNYEAGNNVAELEPKSRDNSTYVLQEYFIPINNFDSFSMKMAEIFNRYKVNVINVSVRHALADPGSYLAWAREEVFAFVIYYKQGTSDSDKDAVKVWTRELIDAAIELNGCHYLPYQVLATPEQFRKAYPNAEKLFALKGKLDPDFRFRNALWNTYYPKSIS